LVAYLGAANHFSKDQISKPENRELMEKAHYFYMAVSIRQLLNVNDDCCLFSNVAAIADTFILC